MKNILVIIGSGLEIGNTATLANAFIKGASEAGHTVHRVFLGDKRISGCKGCGFCQKNNNTCMIKDDMQEIYSLFSKSDVIVFASPLYFWSISAQIKTVIDRLYALSKEDKYPSKETMLLMSAGDTGFYVFEQAISFYRVFTNALGWKNQGMVLAEGCKGAVENKYIDDKYIKQAYDLAKNYK